VHEDVLTHAEWRVAEGVRHGLSNRAIAELQGVSLDAVKFHVSNILTKLGMSRRTELRRWNGVRNTSHLSKGESMQNDIISIGEIGQIARGVKDFDSSVAWYRDVLCLPLLYQFEKLAFFNCQGIRLMLAPDAQPAKSILYFRVNSIHAVVEQLSSRGVSIISAPHLIHTHVDGTEEWMAFFSDNEGSPLALMSQVLPRGDKE
jgi:DNA-binding CsgD family transcriptional regulator/catechol 2,3-dioxygenase-like lactoylglutathione lyase family enzyme